jgi:hypothetical protein
MIETDTIGLGAGCLLAPLLSGTGWEIAVAVTSAAALTQPECFQLSQVGLLLPTHSSKAARESAAYLL